jgi:glycerol kinase
VARHLLAIDQGTTGTTALVMDLSGRALGRATREFPQHFPRPSWVEHDADEIWASVIGATAAALEAAAVGWDAVGAIGITNQRETTLVWDRATGRALYPAIVWQDRRTAPRCAELARQGHGQKVREVTGLVLDPYFSATKIAWILDAVPGARTRAERGELAFGTIDSYLAYRLTGGAVHVTDVTNASRTLLMDIRALAYSPAMLELFGVPEAMLPAIVPSAGVVGKTAGGDGIARGIAIAGLAGDQQAALVGQACFAEGDVKCTFGTGAFVLINTGHRPLQSKSGLLTTVGWRIGDDVVYALEGSAFVAGAAVQWLRDGLGIIESARAIEALARRVSSSDGVVFVPALAGLGAPHWDPDARGLICGLTRGTTAANLARATLDAIAFEVDDLVRAMADDLGRQVVRMRVDGGAAANDLLLELTADISNLTVERPAELESTARGAAMLAGLGAGMLTGAADAARLAPVARSFAPSIGQGERDERRRAWQDAIRRTKSR